jgi:hypothetical protein
VNNGLPRPSEAVVQAQCLKLLQARSVFVFRNNTGCATLPGKGGKPRPVRFGIPGGPDILGVLPGGRFLGVECKRPLGPRGGAAGSEQTPEQADFQRRVEEAGGLYWLVRSSEELERKLDEVTAA